MPLRFDRARLRPRVLLVLVLALVATAPLSQAGESERSVLYALDATHPDHGEGRGMLELRFRGEQVDAVQTLTFGDGTFEEVHARGVLEDGELVASARVGGEGRGLVQGLAAAPGHEEPRHWLAVSLRGEQVETTLRLPRCPITTRARGALQPESDGQGLSEAGARTWYHRTQGLTIAPAAWIDALELPASEAPFKAPANMARYGFLEDPDDPRGLPVGLAVQGANVGLTCGACHTAELVVGASSLRVEGGRANLDLGLFQAELGQALAVTARTPAKLERFAQRVRAAQGQSTDAAGVGAMAGQLQAFLAEAQRRAEVSQALGSTVAGPGRTDAFGNGGNTIFGALDPSNLAPANAPVRLPYLWGTAEFAWVQYNGGISLPLARNLTASIAAGARLEILDAAGDLLPPAQRYESSARVEDLEALERAMAEIQPPRWPGPVDAQVARRGEQLYRQRCAACHDDAAVRVGGKLNLPLYPLDQIGTDPGEALAFRREVNTAPAGLRSPLPVPAGLKAITDRILVKQLVALGRGQPAIVALLRRSKFRAPLAYRARSLEGVWAAAPYLHNGSVRSIYELLGPAAERATRFKLSTRPVLDTARLGLVEPATGWEFDTTLPGNANTGHEFRDAPAGTPGVIGPRLSERERYDLIEFLKLR